METSRLVIFVGVHLGSTGAREHHVLLPALISIEPLVLLFAEEILLADLDYEIAVPFNANLPRPSLVRCLSTRILNLHRVSDVCKNKLAIVLPEESIHLGLILALPAA